MYDVNKFFLHKNLTSDSYLSDIVFKSNDIESDSLVSFFFFGLPLFFFSVSGTVFCFQLYQNHLMVFVVVFVVSVPVLNVFNEIVDSLKYLINQISSSCVCLLSCILSYIIDSTYLYLLLG